MYVRTYASTDCKGRGDYQNRIATDQYHMTISRAHVSTHRGGVIYLLSADQLFY